MNLPGDPTLPPGISDWHFAEGPDACDACDGTGELNVSDCCGARLDGEWGERMVCPVCGENCERPHCEDCGGSGTGETDTERNSRVAEDRADRWRDEERMRNLERSHKRHN